MTLFLVSFYFVYKITKDYLFLQGKLLIFFLFFIYTLKVEGEGFKYEYLY